jgi:peptidoglycan LD-endopeptidase CwlK
MINSRSLDDLHPFVKSLAISLKARFELETSCELLITSTFRDSESQDALYAEGRTAPGAIVTNAKAGESAHNYGLAFDVVPIRNGKPVWDSKDDLWQVVGRLGKEEGLFWGGDWIHFREFPHLQDLGGLTIKDLQNGMEPDFTQRP